MNDTTYQALAKGAVNHIRSSLKAGDTSVGELSELVGMAPNDFINLLESPEPETGQLTGLQWQKLLQNCNVSQIAWVYESIAQPTNGEETETGIEMLKASASSMQLAAAQGGANCGIAPSKDNMTSFLGCLQLAQSFFAKAG
ncbi:MAG: hypothetical protein AAF065_05535 [Verrucomicrobiota bacterium]